MNNYWLFWTVWFLLAVVFWLALARDFVSVVQCLVITVPVTIALLRFRHRQKSRLRR